MSKKIFDFAVPSDLETANNNNLWVFGDPVTGKLYKPTGVQVKATFAVQKTKYTASGSEGTALTIPALSAKEILLIAREGQIIYEAVSSPDQSEFTWNGTTITLGLAVQRAGERFLILYKTA